MRKFGATEGGIRLRRGARIKGTTLAFMLKSRARRLTVLEYEGGGGVCLFTQPMNTRMPTSTVVFFFFNFQYL